MNDLLALIQSSCQSKGKR